MISKFILTELIFSISLVAFFFGSWLFLSQFIWYGDELLYPLLSLVGSNHLFFLILVWIIGVLAIAIYYYIKALNNIKLIADASEVISNREDTYISLPDDLKDIELQLNKIKGEAIKNENIAKEAEKRKNDLIVYLAHDLKTPLTSTIGYLSILSEEEKLSNKLRQHYLSIALEKANRLEDLINEFFEITRFNFSKISLHYGSTNIVRMIEQVAFEFNPILQEKNLSYTITKNEDIDLVCDVDKIQRVFDNLITNAITYCYDDSNIDIIIESDTEDAIITIKNSGKTIAPENLEHIFDQFYRLDTARSSKTGGSGLGLAIAKEIIEVHGGTIKVESYDETVTFVITLPIVRKL